MGIPHIEDLTPDQLEVITQAKLLRLTSKIDGSFLAFGVDADNQFYTERKGGQRYYHVEDWPMEGWSLGFRQAHVALENFLDALRELGKAGRCSRATCEVILGSQPNVVEYTHDNQIVIHPGANFDSAAMTCVVSLGHMATDGREEWSTRHEIEWNISVLSVRDWKKFPTEEAQFILDWLDLPSRIKPYTMRQVLAFKFNRKPEGYTKEAWKTTLPLLKEERERVREAYAYHMGVLRRKCLVSLNQNISYETVPSHTMSEGYVVSGVDGTLFKIINREWFKPANDFVHWVRYALIGGRRPDRPSFESRTRHWALEKRLDRLEVLRQRYLRRRHELQFKHDAGPRVGDLHYSDEIHDRMLKLFYDLRERMKDGRAGLQRKHAANLPSGDTSDTGVAGRPVVATRSDAKIPA